MSFKYLLVIVAFCALGALVAVLLKETGLVTATGLLGPIWWFITIAGSLWFGPKLGGRK
ncbi:hypothetical protein [Streptomyces sp. FH025]|uniref:hypothetical protein n=1 Tax=Streptomyces sp. FH025 TaxID=2815937 RepID=UPI001A9EC970|nr:hypothetical protein [Streptomyces sp. FH025]MBO1414412.1 hypothetical protein [Streptomyces sp. FH025]